MGKYRPFQRPVNLLTPMGLFQFICSADFQQLVVFKKKKKKKKKKNKGLAKSSIVDLKVIQRFSQP